MKKLLSILTSVSVASVAATSVVACSVPSTHIDVNFNSNNGNLKSNADGSEYTWKGVSYSKSDLDSALNGNSAILNAYFPVAMTFDDLNRQLLSLVSFNQSLTVKTQKNQQELRNFRDTYLGRDDNTLTGDHYKDVPSVDGIKYKGIDTDKYYDNFKNTSVNSLIGLQDLYNAGKKDDKGQITGPQDSWSDTLKASFELAKNIFGTDNKDVKELMENFANSKKNPAFTNITYDTDLQEYDSKSQLINPFDKNNDNGEKLGIGEAQDYVKNNPSITGDDAVVKDKKISEKAKADPYGALILPTSDDISAGITTKSLNNISSKAADGQTLQEVFKKDSDEVYYSQVENTEGEKYSFSQNLGQYLVKPVKDFKVSYHFETDIKHSAKNWTDVKKDSKGFNISFKLNNLAEVFSPYITGVEGTTVTSIEHKDGNLKVVFNDADLKDSDLTDAKGHLSGLNVADKIEVNGGNKIQHDKTKKGANTNSYIIVKGMDDGEISYKDNGVDFKYTAVKGQNSSFETTQLAWVFRGYKFISSDVINGKTKGWTEDMTNEHLVKADKKTKAPERNADLAAEIDHSLRDMKTSDWDIHSSAEPEGPHYQKN